MNRNENTPKIIDGLNDYMDTDDRARWLAEVRSIWNCDEYNWAPAAPFLVRTEMRDILLNWPDGQHMVIGVNPIDDEDALGPNESLAWRRRPGCDEFIGSRISRFAFEDSEMSEALWITFEDGQRVRFSPAGVIACMESGAMAGGSRPSKESSEA